MEISQHVGRIGSSSAGTPDYTNTINWLRQNQRTMAGAIPEQFHASWIPTGIATGPMGVVDVAEDKPDEPYQPVKASAVAGGQKVKAKVKAEKPQRVVKKWKGKIPNLGDFAPQPDDKNQHWNNRSFREFGGTRIKFKGKAGKVQEAEAGKQVGSRWGPPVLVGERGNFHIVWKGRMLPMATTWKPLWDKNAPPSNKRISQPLVQWSTKHWGKIEDY